MLPGTAWAGWGAQDIFCLPLMGSDQLEPLPVPPWLWVTLGPGQGRVPPWQVVALVLGGAVLPLEKLEAMWLLWGETAEPWVSLAWGCPRGKGQGWPSLVLFGGGSSVTTPVPLLEQLSLGVPPFISFTYISKALQCVLRKVSLLYCTAKI